MTKHVRPRYVPGMKYCPGCKQHLPHNAFYRVRRFGLSWRCQDCVREYMRAMYQRKKAERVDRTA